MTSRVRSACFIGSLVAAVSGVGPASAQSTNPAEPGKPAFVDERRLPGAQRDNEERQRAAEEESRKAAEEVRKRLEAEAAALKAQLEAAAAEQRKRMEAEAEALRQRIGAEEEARKRAAAEAAEASRKAEAERRAKAEEEARQRAAMEAAEAARKAEAARQAKAAEEAQQRAAAEAAKKAEAERQAEAEARRKQLNNTGNPAEAARFLSRGQQFLRIGDFASARLFLERASDAGSADAALLLAETYDAATLARLGGIGIAANAGLARRWYQRAADLGSPVAADRLKRLGGQ